MEVLCSLFRGCRCQSLAYLLTFLGSLWLRISRFRAEKRLVEEAPTLVVGTPDHVKEFRRTLESNHVDFRNGLLVMAPEEVDSAVVRDLLIKNCVSKVVFLPEEVDSSVARCLVELCGKMGVDFYASMVVSMPAVHKTYFGVIGGTRMLVYKSTPIPYTTSWQLKKMLDWTGALALLVGTSPCGCWRLWESSCRIVARSFTARNVPGCMVGSLACGSSAPCTGTRIRGWMK